MYTTPRGGGEGGRYRTGTIRLKNPWRQFLISHFPAQAPRRSLLWNGPQAQKTGRDCHVPISSYHTTWPPPPFSPLIRFFTQPFPWRHFSPSRATSAFYSTLLYSTLPSSYRSAASQCSVGKTHRGGWLERMNRPLLLYPGGLLALLLALEKTRALFCAPPAHVCVCVWFCSREIYICMLLIYPLFLLPIFFLLSFILLFWFFQEFSTRVAQGFQEKPGVCDDHGQNFSEKKIRPWDFVEMQ